MIAPGGLDAVMDPLRRLFVKQRGAPVPLTTWPLEPDEAALLFPGGRDDLAVVRARRRRVTPRSSPGEDVTAVVAVADREAAVLVWPGLGPGDAPPASRRRRAWGGRPAPLAGFLGRLRT